MVHGQIAQYTCLYQDFLSVRFPLDFVAVEADRLTDFDVAFLSSLEDLSEKVEKKRENNKPSLDGERYYTDKELAVRLKVSRRSLQDYRNNGILPYIQIGGRILYRVSDIERTLMDG